MGVLVLAIFMLQAAPASCPDAAACRAAAEAAAANGDYETFHDLAWRAVQKGRPNDPALMVLLARAQSLSGRPGDALVMLGRLADLHAAVDVSLPDFDRARRLPGWADVEARLRGAATPAANEPAAPSAARPGVAPPPAVSKSEEPRPEPATEAPRTDAAPSSSAAPRVLDSLSFDPPANLGAFALAHDSVSRRFVVGDAPSRRLLVIDEVSKHVVPYVSAASAGFYQDLTGLTIDARRGDLWVISATGTGADATSIVQKLQLVSGRGLMDVRPAESLAPLRLVDVAVTADGTVFALDAAGSRLFRLRAGSRSLEVAQHLDTAHWTALTASDDHTVFAASDRGIVRVDLASGAVQPVKSVEDLGGFVSLAWRNGALVGVQRTAGVSLVVRVALDAAGTRAQPRAILAAGTFPIVGTLAGSSFYYLTDAGTINRIAVR